jgi:hypothetical protein
MSREIHRAASTIARLALQICQAADLKMSLESIKCERQAHHQAHQAHFLEGHLSHPGRSGTSCNQSMALRKSATGTYSMLPKTLTASKLTLLS